jgi:SAM-dependent methyltransferase
MKLDLGAGKNKKEGFIGVDSIAFEGVDIVHDLTQTPWPFEDNSVDEIHASHFVEHLTAPQRIAFVNECYRILKDGAKCTIITPHWASTRAYGDLTHQWPPVCEMWYYYLNKEWRAINAPHNQDYQCNFDASWGYSMHPELLTRTPEHQTRALAFYKEAAQDLHATIIKKKPE